ncbi:MAG: ATP-binding protein [Actinomycetota bacterium]
MLFFRSRRPTLALLAGGSVALSCLAAAGAVFGALMAVGRLNSSDALVAGSMSVFVAALTGTVCGWVASRLARQVRAVQVGAMRRLQHRGESPPVPAITSFAELRDLASTIDALAARTRVADDTAERHRRTAQNASAGMFELLSGLIAAEEGARGQLSAELHDTAAQSLALARAELAVGDSEAIRRATDYVAEAEEQVRAVMARTRPPALRDGDLASAVDMMRAELDNRYGLKVEVSWPASAYPLPLASAITIYRFFQESLLNVVKHADVDWAQATLDIDSDWVTATVSDAGPGFDPTQVKSEKGRHVGLGLLRERARLAGGSLELSSMVSAGTTLRLRLPSTGVPATATIDPVTAPVG